MLDAYIIEEIKRREDARRRKDDAARPRLQIDLPKRVPGEEQPREEDPPQEDEPQDAGVFHIDL